MHIFRSLAYTDYEKVLPLDEATEMPPDDDDELPELEDVTDIPPDDTVPASSDDEHPLPLRDATEIPPPNTSKFFIAPRYPGYIPHFTQLAMRQAGANTYRPSSDPNSGEPSQITH